MSKAVCEGARMGTPQFYFGRSSFAKASAVAEGYGGQDGGQAGLARGEDSDEVKVYLLCPACNAGEELPVR